MENYRHMVEWSANTLVDPLPIIQDNTLRMKQAAAGLNFESARKIKTYVDSLSHLGKGPFRHVRQLRDFKYLSFQRGPRDVMVKVFLITPGSIEELCGLLGPPEHPAELISAAMAQATAAPIDSLDQIGSERVGVVSYHLFSPKATQGVFLPLDSIDEKAVVKGFRDLQKQKKDEVGDEIEGVTKELQAMG
jgi:excinuclease UvrABC nuclease subunit